MKGKTGTFLAAICLTFANLERTAGEDIVGRDISTLGRIPDHDNVLDPSAASALLANRDVRYHALENRQLIHPSLLVHARSEDLIHLAVIASNVNTTAVDEEKVPRTEEEVEMYLRGFLRMMFSIFESSTGTPIHLVIITDRASRLIAENTVVYSMGRYLSTAIIQNVGGGGPPSFPARFLVEFVNLTDITATYRDQIDEMKKYYVFEKVPELVPQPDGGFLQPYSKFMLDLFFIAPFYHLGKKSTLLDNN